MFPSPVDEMEDDECRAMRLAELSEEFLTSYREGSCRSVAEFALQFPDLRDEIETSFPTLLALEEIKLEQLTRVTSSRAECIRTLSNLGDFSIGREIGRGGMGVVYEARQLSLGRRVAVKVLSQKGTTRRDIERFHQEARIAAQLHHSNIVPIYGSGTEAECHYFAMQRIDGIGLDEVIFDPGRLGPDISDSDERFSRWVASVGIQVGEALAYSHQANYLHQDVKPANLIQDENGRIWLTDFGLATLTKLARHCRGGTARYRAPERMQERCDVRSDIFSLGVTLHDLLAARFLAKNRHAVHHHRFSNLLDHPSHARRVRSLPRDLRAIVHKATQAEPAQRYQSAEQIVEDLQRFLHDRVVSARRVGAAGHFYRWARRNRMLTTSLLLLTSVVVSSAAYFVHTDIQTSQLNDRLQGLNAELAANNDRLAKNNDRLANAFFAVSALLRTSVVAALPKDQIAELNDGVVLEGDPGGVFEAVDDGSGQLRYPLKRVLPGHPTVMAGLGENPQLILSAFRAPRRVAETMHSFGRLSEAEAAYAYALELARLAEKLPDPPRDLIAFREARIWNDLGQIAADRCDFLAAEELHTKALTTLNTQPGTYQNGLGDHERARAIFGQRFPLADELEALGVVQGAWSTENYGHVAERNGISAGNNESLAELQQVIAMCESTLDIRESHHARVLMGFCRIKLARQTIADPQERMAVFETNLARIKSIAERPSHEPRYRHAYAEILASPELIRAVGDAHDREWVRRNLTDALEIVTELSRRYPSSPGYRFTEADVSHKLAILAHASGDLGSAGTYFDIARDQLRELVTKFPRNPRYRLWRCVLEASYAHFLASQGRMPEARPALQVARSEFTSIPGSTVSPQVLEFARQFVASTDKWLPDIENDP